MAFELCRYCNKIVISPNGKRAKLYCSEEHRLLNNPRKARPKVDREELLQGFERLYQRKNRRKAKGTSLDEALSVVEANRAARSEVSKRQFKAQMKDRLERLAKKGQGR